MQRLKKITSIVLLFAFGTLNAEEAKPELSFKSTEVMPGIYMLSGVGGFTGGNIGLSVGKDGIVMIDDAMPATLGIMQAAIKNITSEPIDFLINTHVHADHIGNNSAIAENGAHIVAHENLRTHLINKGISQGNQVIKAPKDALPVITFSKSMSFHLNGEDVRLIHLPKAHTDGDSIIHFTSANVIHTGDIFFNGMFPFIDLNSGGSVDGYIAAQKKILSLSNDKTKIIAGHGPLSNKKELAAALAMLEDAKTLISDEIKQGKSEDNVVKANPLAKYHDQWHWGFITTERMTRQVYKSLSAH